MASTSTATGGILSSPRAQRRFLLISGSVLVVGIAAFVSVVVLRGPSGIHAGFSGKAQFAPKLKKAPPPPVAYKIARTFIETAPERQNLDVAYRLVGPELKGNQTLKQWEKGNIAVVPYQPENAKTAAFVTDWSYTNQILFDVALIAKPGTQAPHAPSSLDWYLGLRRAGKTGRWVVNYWLPNWIPPHMQGGVGGN